MTGTGPSNAVRVQVSVPSTMDFTQWDALAVRITEQDRQQMFTLFDSVLQTRLVKRHDSWTTADCHRTALSLFPHLGPHPTVKRLAIEVAGQPRPQFVATSFQIPVVSRSFPLDCRALQFGICVVDAPVEATPFTLAFRASSQCNFRGMHPQVAQRILTAFAYSAAFTPFEPIPWAVDSICFFNIAGNTPPASSSTDQTWRVDVAEQIEEVHDLLELTNSDDYHVMVHRPGIAPLAVEASRTWNAVRLADAISEAVGTHVDVHWPGLFPRGTDALLHALLEPPAGLAEDHTLVLLLPGPCLVDSR